MHPLTRLRLAGYTVIADSGYGRCKPKSLSLLEVTLRGMHYEQPMARDIEPIKDSLCDMSAQLS